MSQSVFTDEQIAVIRQIVREEIERKQEADEAELNEIARLISSPISSRLATPDEPKTQSLH